MAVPLARLASERLGGLSCWRLTLPQGDSVLLSEHGGQVLSWVAAGQERLFLSPGAVLDGSFPVRGGIPVCWPQFNRRGAGPKHGFARQLPWLITGYDVQAECAWFELTLCSQAATRALWPHEFELSLAVQLSPGGLQLTLAARNTGPRPWAFGGALHTYLACQDVTQVRLDGLQGARCWDALTDSRDTVSGPLFGPAGCDRVYSEVAGPLRLQEPGWAPLSIECSPDWADSVVWNPGPAATLPDMPAEAWRHMLCVEAAQVFEPVTVLPGQRWSAWQRFAVSA